MTVEIPSLEELFLNFESLGDNCEFGLVQRHAGLEPLGLFRFAFSSMPNVLRALQNRFEKIADLDRIDVTVAKNTELMVHLREYGFYYHVGKHEGDIEIETLRRDEQKKLAFLIRRLIGTLTTGEKIFIRKGEKTKTRQQAKELLNEMRAYGPATLLWVTEADHDNPPGSVRVLEPGLLRGRIDSFAPYTDAHSIGFTGWVDVCQNAYWLWKTAAPAGADAPPPVRVDQAANLLYGGHRDIKITTLPHHVRTQVVSGSFPLRDPFRPTLCRHVLGTDRPTMVGLRVAGLQPGVPYTFSLWARLAPDSDVSQLGIATPGSAMIRGRRPNPYQRRTWQRLEHTARTGADGILFPRLTLKGAVGAVVETANWRLESGVLVNAHENPSSYPPQLLEPQAGAGGTVREMSA